MTNPSPIQAVPGFPEGQLKITARDLTISEEFQSGSSHLISLVENDDLAVILKLGQEGGKCQHVPAPGSCEVAGLVVICLEVDGQHDEVHFYDGAAGLGPLEVIGQAREALQASHRIGAHRQDQPRSLRQRSNPGRRICRDRFRMGRSPTL